LPTTARRRQIDRWMRRALILCFWLGAACRPASGTPVPYALTQRPVLPFPTDALTVPDPSAPSGLRIHLDANGRNLGDVDEALFLFGDDFAQAFAVMDGFSVLGPAFIQVPEPPDMATIDQRLVLVDLTAKTVVKTTKDTIDGATKDGRQLHFGSARPILPLAQKTAHAIVLLAGARGMKAAYARPHVFDQVWSGAAVKSIEGDPVRIAAAEQRLATLRAALPALRISADEVIAADVFTTESVLDETYALAAAYRAQPAPVINLDTDGDGKPDLYANPHSDPRWEGPMDEDDSAVALMARFTIQVPSFREGGDPRARLDLDPTGATLHGSEKVEGLLIVPKGSGPFPIVQWQHGIGNHKENVWRYAPDFAKIGLATIAFDAPLHGARTDQPDSASTQFINIADPKVVVDNFRQAETEHVYLVRAADALAALDLFGDGSHLDPAHVFWVGHSLGSMIGAGAIGLEPRYEGAVLVVGGGTLLEFFDRALGGLGLHQFPGELFTNIAQTAVDRGDPTNYGPLSLEKQVLLMQAMEDETMPAKATEDLGRAMELPQVAPVHRGVDGVRSVSSPELRRGWTQWDPAMHSLTYAPGNAPDTYAKARAQMFHFLESWSRTGAGEILAP
jgi:dienelactone hydrolase